MILAVLDLGSSSFHSQVVSIDEAGGMSVLADEKVTVRLGAALREGVIGTVQWESGLSAAEALVAHARRLGAVRIAAVGTCTLREAANGGAFARAVQERCGVEVEILGGDEEARLAYLGARTAVADGDGLVAVLDVGGGSVQLAVGRGERCVLTRSLPLGVVRLRDRVLGPDGVLTKTQVQGIADEVRAAAAEPMAALRELAPSALVLTGGTPRRLARLASRLRDGAPPPGDLTRQSAVQWAVHLVGQEPAMLAAFGVAARYRDTIGAGAVVVATLMTLLGFAQARVCDLGVRDGVLARELARHGAAEVTHVSPALRAPVTSVRHSGGHDEDWTSH